MNGSLRERIIQKKFFRQKKNFLKFSRKFLYEPTQNFFFQKFIIKKFFSTNPANFFSVDEIGPIFHICVQKFIQESSWLTVDGGRIVQ